MALHKTHEFFNLVLYIPAVAFLPKEYLVPFSLGYFLGTFLLSPDIDLSFSKPARRWRFLRFLWLPFWVFSRHRGITHVPLLGSLVKLFYLGFLFVFLYFVILGILSFINITPKAYLNFNPINFLENFLKSESGFYFVLGVVLADLFHILLDFITSSWKKLRRL
ncbi:DUF2227 family putative metal-binding protein [Aquifex sp.]